MFFDLNIRIPTSMHQLNLTEETLTQLNEYGYRAVAIVSEIDESVLENVKKKKMKKIADLVPQPCDISILTNKFPKVKFYRRVNIFARDPGNLRQIMKTKNIKKYDLISVQPENQNVLKTLSGSNDIDIISFNAQTRCPLQFSRKLYNFFVNQNVFFELMYAPAVCDSSARKNLIALSHLYHAVGKSKNVIMSSGAELSTHIRGPYDVVNFSLLFGLSEEQAKSAISRNCERLLRSARARRRVKAVIELHDVKTADAKLEDTKVDEIEPPTELMEESTDPEEGTSAPTEMKIYE